MLETGILMHSLNSRGVHSENLRIFPNCTPNKMDYRQKMVVPSVQKLKHDEDEDEDLEALRLAALKSLRAKNTLQSVRQPVSLPQPVVSRIGHQPQVYNHQRQMRRGGFYQNRPLRQNGNVYHPSRVNQNLIEIVPVEEDDVLMKDLPQVDVPTLKSHSPEDINNEGESKFYRYKDNASGSEEDDAKESNNTEMKGLAGKNECLEKGGLEVEESGAERNNHIGVEDSPGEHGLEDDNEAEEEEEDDEDEEEEEEEEKPTNDDDDDVLLMADLEEEDSLERLMDEMEREMNVDNKPTEKKEKKLAKKDSKESKRKDEVTTKTRNHKVRDERASEKNGSASATVSSSSSAMQNERQVKNERRSISPRPLNRTIQKRRSLSPKPRLRKKSPRRSPPRRSPTRQAKKSLREMPRPRSPRKSPPSRFSPRPRSPKLSPRPRSPRLSPRRSPNHRSPGRRSPLRKLSPRMRSPHSRSPRLRRSRSPLVISRSRSPRPLRSPKRSNRSRSPRIIRSRSPRISPVRLSPRACTPRSKSPRLSPHRLSPLRRASSRTRSPRMSPRRSSPRIRSPKISPERRRGSPARARSPRNSPQRSPWSTPRNSPRLSPRRRRSPKESTRKTRPRSVTPEEIPAMTYKKEVSPVRKKAASPDLIKSKVKQRENVTVSRTDPAPTKDPVETTNDPVLEARRRKFECTKPIDPVHDNKKIKLTKKDNTSKKIDAPEEPEQPAEVTKPRKTTKIVEDFDVEDSDLCLNEDYVYDVLEEDASDASSTTNAVAMCVQVVPVKTEKERSKKKKKRDKELYQVGKLKGELPLSERIGKDKKCKKRKDRTSTPIESSPEQAAAVVQDLTVDEESDLRTELSRRRAERLNRAAPIQSARLLQSAFKGVVKEVAKTNAKAIQRHAAKAEDKNNKKGVRRVTVLHRALSDLPDSEEETVADSKVPVRFRLGINKPAQESRDSKTSRKSSKRQGRKVKHKNNLSLNDNERKN